MIQLLAVKYNKHIAYVLLLLFMSSLAPVYGRVGRKGWRVTPVRYYAPVSPAAGRPVAAQRVTAAPAAATPVNSSTRTVAHKPRSVDIGGPSQPEMSSFQAAGANNMVNLFTGDFSYNIPLLDVGGYPVNIFYDGSVSMEQEASWVGLGWNINPGNINRNMRGIPDDFNGNDTLVTIQTMKANKTWGVNLGADLEITGVKKLPDWLAVSAGLNLGVSFNNYLGPALDLGIKGGVTFKIAEKVKSEKPADTSALKVGIGLSANINSRYGLTLSPNVSLTASHFTSSRSVSTGLTLGTSYNSRTGIRSLQISDQMSFSGTEEKRKVNFKNGKPSTTFNPTKYSSTNSILAGTSISFAKPSYIPAIRMPLTNEAWSGHFQLGGAIWGVYGSAEAEVYGQVSRVAAGDVEQKKPMVGYLYYENARNNPAAVMDFTRLNDKEVTSNTPVISAPQYTYDVFSIQGEGTGGSIRAYRNDHGYVRDNHTVSRDKNLSIGADVGVPGHFGANVNSIQTPAAIGEWGQGNLLRNGIGFTKSSGTWENVYFRNPGEISVLHEEQFNKIGGADMVRFRLGGTRKSPTVEPVLERFSPAQQLLGTVSMTSTAEPAERKKRTQVISMLTAQDASVAGLETVIRSYDNQQWLDTSRQLIFSSIPRVGEYRKAHHISQIDVTEADGKRYVYGIPVYNILQKDFTFSVATPADSNMVQNEAELTTFVASDTGPGADHLSDASKVDGFLQVTRTPAYAHSFLLSGLLSPDYVDVTGNGITEDDLGGAVKFNYTKIDGIHKWRTPLTNDRLANFNPGHLTVTKDNKGIIAYGERESWYLHSIESKTMIAFFRLGSRSDGKGAEDELEGIDNDDQSMKRLDRIDLYNKADLKKNGLQNARPVKSVHFQYSYALCAEAPGNNSSTETVDGQNVNATKGKLTLDKIYFTFNGQSRASKNQYLFNYGPDTLQNPKYALGASDRWGSYKPRWMNPDNMKNADFPYTIQPKTATDSIRKQQQAGAWALKKILLPSGSQLEVEYESDDYAFVQDRRASVMTQIVGFGTANGPVTSNLYQTYWPTGAPGSNALAGMREHERVYIKVPAACSTRAEVLERYLRNGTSPGPAQLAFRLAVNMPKGMEYISAYATIADYGVHSVQDSIIWVQLNAVDGISPLSLTALEYLREQLPGQAYPGYDVSESSGLKQLGEMMAGWGSAIKSAFRDPLKHLRSQGLAKSVILARSFVRLSDPDGRKYGGGHRVRKVVLKDNWNAMTSQYTSTYGQEYSYTTTEVFEGKTRTISSGVASYEPGIGGEENPFQTILQVANKLPLGPTSYGAIEMPVLDAFFPAPVVGYSKVTVRSLHKSMPGQKKSRSGVGRQVSEFYTAKDFPVYYNYTALDPASDKQAHTAALNAYFYKYAFDSRALSQGFIVATNDMHGRMKSQSSYAENDSTTRINYTENFYRNTGRLGLEDKFDFIRSSEGGLVQPGNMGIDIELMTDTREFSIKSTSREVQAQLDLFPVVFPIWLPFIWPVFGNSENTYRAVTTTKAISYHAILDSVVVIDKGSQVSTKNLVYDAETGSLIVSRTNNEFDKPVYNVNYPAWWAYSGMGLAYKNIDAVYTGVKFLDGKIVAGMTAADMKNIESGDELYLINPGSPSSDNCGAKMESGKGVVLWAFDKHKNTQSLTNITPDFVFVDTAGKLYTKDAVSFRIIRSGKRNMLNAMVASVTSMTNPVNAVTNKLYIQATSKVVSASTLEYKEKWQVDADAVRTLREVLNPATCAYEEVLDCNGYLERKINPYRKGLVGNFRAHRSLVFYGNRADTSVSIATNLANNGFLKNFKLYWDFDANKNLVPDSSNTQWIWNSEATRFNAKGMELETRNALNIYTAAQYGYSKSLPVAITNNARYSEVVNENFEDTEYQDNMSASTGYSCPVPHSLFSTFPANTLINTDSLSFAAHTGRYVLGVNKGILQKTFKVSTGDPVDFNFQYTKDTIKSLYNLGYNLEHLPSLPAYWSNASSGRPYTESIMTGSFPNTFFLLNITDNVDYDSSFNIDQGCIFLHSNGMNVKQYINVSQSGYYNLSIYTECNACDQNGGTTSSIGVSLFDEKNIIVYSDYTQMGMPAKGTHQFLCKGVYRVETTVNVNRNYTSPECSMGFLPNIYFLFNTNIPSPSYKSHDKQNGCIYSNPIPAQAEMMHPTFSLPAGKKMLFSAWVKEPCGNPATGVPCNKSTYADNSVKLQFDDPGTGTDVTLTPTGPIIDGWQRVEGAFGVPANATTMNLSLINNVGAMAYYDDIRLHPADANMKSFVYDPVNLRLVAELDANNYATFYEYDAEGGLIRTKAETNEGIKTIQETRSYKQKPVTTIQTH